MQKTKLVLVMVASLAIIASAWLLSVGIKHFRSGSPQITVTGVAERNIKSDLIVWTIYVSALNSNQEIAYNEHQSNREQIVKYLMASGITEEQIRYSSTNVSNEYDQYYDDNTQKYMRTFRGIQLSSEIIVSSNDVDNVEVIYQKISELLKQGVNFTARAPRYYYTQINTLKMEMLQEASQNAYARAKTIAEGSNSSLSDLASSTMGVFQIVGLNSEEDYSWGGTFNTSSKLKTASVTVRSSYKIK
ncbi:SIMPL domain-containing protein [Porphyromonas sp. COT-290 OH3588]|uniref:SIMPL domain-containing protein n=1 Tax=Porphyromonas sp. COT-290 OH3588 TaxID=1515617 RepID=UPI00052D8BF4|nr:SIMPL domain-containing protein [Porphyromonas sp. COT-290 OH3588]KGO00849.1 hypothetical protein HQ48_05280 [Porphyromonas sp. COT-290 OH3588]